MEEYVFRLVDEQVELCSKIVKLSCFLANPKVELPEHKRVAMNNQLDAMSRYFDILSKRIKVEFDEERQQEKEAAEKELQDIKSKRFEWIGAEETVDEQGNHWINPRDPRYPVSKFEK